jgi:hypothetical protein
MVDTRAIFLAQDSLGARQWIKKLAYIWMAAIVVFHIGLAAAGRPFYRDQHIGAAINYARGSIDLLRPQIPGFNLNGVPTPMELPLWQASAALLMKGFGIWFGWGNLASMLWFFPCLYPLYQLAEKYGEPGSGWWTLLLFLAQPLIFVFAGEAGVDGQAMAAAIWFLYFASRLWEEPNMKWFAATITAGGVAAVTKMPFFMSAGLACALFVSANRRRQIKPWIWLSAAAVVIAACFAVWENYVNRLYPLAELPCQDLRSSSPGMVFWYYGDLHYRLSPIVYIKGAYRAMNDLFGSFAFSALFFWGLFQARWNRLAVLWIIGGVGTTLVFFHIVLNHHNYYLMFSPAVAIVSAQAAMRLENILLRAGEAWQWPARAVVALTLALSLIQGLDGSHAIIMLDKYPYAIAEVIRQRTNPSEKLLVTGNGFGGQYFLLADRKGLSIWTTQLLEDKDIYARLKKLGYTKLVMVSESPLIAAIERSNSPGLKTNRHLYQADTTPIVDTLPTVLQNEDILIKDLP